MRVDNADFVQTIFWNYFWWFHIFTNSDSQSITLFFLWCLWIPSMLNPDMSLHVCDTGGRWHHLTVQYCDSLERHAPSKAAPRSVSAKLKRQSTLRLRFHLRGRVRKFDKTTVSSQRSGPCRSLYRWLSSFESPNLKGQHVRAYWWLWVARLWKILQLYWHKRQCSSPFSSLVSWASCASDSSDIHAKQKRNPTGQQSAADSQR